MTTTLRSALLGATILAVLTTACGGSDDPCVSTQDCTTSSDDQLGIVPLPPTGSAQPPQITGASTYAAAPGDTITITGRYFDSVVYPILAVRFGSDTSPNATFTTTSPTTMTVRIPGGARTGRIFLIDRIGQTGATGQVTSAFTFSIVPVAPTNLRSQVIDWSQIQLDWTDNSFDETAFEVWKSQDHGPFTWVGQLDPNDHSEPITGLAPATNYTFRVRALNASGASAYTNDVDVRTLALPTVDFSTLNDPANPRWPLPTPLLAGRARLRNVFAFLDTNHDGLVANAAFDQPESSSSLFPNYMGTGAPRPWLRGRRFAPGTNLIILAELETWTTVQRVQFVAVHATVLSNGTVTMATALGGDEYESFPAPTSYNGIVMGAYGAPTFALSVQNGHVSGWVSGLLSFLDSTNNLYGAQFTFQFPEGIPVYDE